MNRTLAILTLVVVLFATCRFTYVEPVALASWAAWGADDILTHYLTETSVPVFFQLKCWLFDLNEYLQPSEFVPESAVRELSAKEYTFELVDEATEEPLVVRGLFSESSSMKKWKDISYLNDTIGDVTCPVVMENHDDFETWRVARTYREIFDSLTMGKGGKENKASAMYVSGDQFIFRGSAGEALLADLELEKYLGAKYMNSPLYSQEDCYLFMGASGRSGTSWHCAPNRSMFLLVLGRKKWTFIHSKYSAILRPQRSHLYSRIFLAFKRFHKFVSEEEKNLGRADAGVDVDGNLFEHVPRSTVVLQPGDALFVPSWYWHHVENIESDEVMTIGVDVDTHVWNHAWMNALFPPF